MKLALLSAACCVLAAEQAVEEQLWPPDHRDDAIVEQGRSQEWSCRIRIHSSGNREVSVAAAWRRQPDRTGRNAPRECAVQWVGNYRISCQGSINPSARVLLLFDALSGRELLEQFGLEFAWSPDGQVLASPGNIARRTGRIATHRLPWPGAKEVDFPAPRDFAIRWSGGGIVVEHGGKTHSVAAP